MFSKQEAVSFLETSLGVEHVEHRLQSDRKNLLDEIIITIQGKIPFQSLTLMAVPPGERSRPNVEAIKAECMAGIGGLCYNLNVFTWGLLKGLGYFAQLCPATCTSSVTSPNNHLLVLVHDLQNRGDVHLVECGFGFPTFRAVPLDFESESPVYVDSFLEYKYVKINDQYLRMHGKGDMIKRNDPPVEGLDFFQGHWRRFYFFSLRPADCLDVFNETFDRCFTVPRATPFDHSPRALWFPGKRAVIVVNDKLMLEGDGGVLETSILAGDEEIIQCFRRHFPQISEVIVRNAVSEWRRLLQSSEH